MSALMRVGVDLSICAFNQAGSARYARSLWQALQALRAQDETLTLVPLSLPPAMRATGAGPRRKAVTLFWETVYAHVWLPALARRHRLDLLHLTVPLPVGPIGCPVVTTVLDAIPILFPQWFSTLMGWRLRRWLRAATRRSAHLIAISQSTADDVARLALAPGVPITVVPLGSYLELLPAYPPTAEPPMDPPYLLTVGTLEPRKNLGTVLVSYRSLTERLPGAPPLVVVGPTGWLADDVLASAARLGLGGRVRLAGFVSDARLQQLYRHASMLIYPSLYEGFGMPPLEAMGSGCPVIVSDRASLPEVVGDAGLLVDPLDEAALADAMRHLLTDDALADRLRTRGRARARRFSWARCARETVAVYRRVVTRG